MAQLQFRSDDTILWEEKFGNGTGGAGSISSDTTDSTPVTICSGTSASTTLTVSSSTGFSVGDLVLIHQTRNGTPGAGAWQLNKINNISGITWTMKYILTNTYDTTSQVIRLIQYSSFTVDVTKTLSVATWAGSTGALLPILCNGTITINGIISASAKGYRGGTGAFNNSSSQYGEGTAGAAATTSVNTANGNGGGKGGNTSGGSIGSAGGGGNGAVGTAGTGDGGTTNGSGGDAAGNAGLTVAVPGGGGGGGMTNFPAGSGAATGGIGGGVVFLFGKTITLGASGSIVANGSVGTQATDSASRKFAGGGGAGGSILLKGQTISLGSSLVTATGGAGVSGSPSTSGAGSVGRIHADYLTSLSGTTSPAIDSRVDPSLTISSAGGSNASFLFLMT
jgi:hypothetical protein